MKAFVGVDVCKENLDIAVIVENKVCLSRQFSNSKKGIKSLIGAVKKNFKCEILFGCEATGIYDRLFLSLVNEAFYPVVRINPRFTKNELCAMNLKSSNDKVDAVLIAQRLTRGIDPLWEPKGKELDELEDLITRRSQLILMLQAERNHLERFNKGSFSFKSVMARIKDLEKEVSAITQAIKILVKENEKIRKMTTLARTVPGVGEIISASFVATVGNIRKYENAEQVVSFVGLCPQEKISGKSVRKSHLSRSGDSLFRKLLYMGAVSNIRRENVFHEYYRGLISRGKSAKTALVAIMRKMVRAMFAVLRDEIPFSTERYGKQKLSVNNA